MHIDGHVYASRHLAQLESAFTAVLQRVLTEQPDDPIAWAGRALLEYASGGAQQQLSAPSKCPAKPRTEKLENFQRTAAATRLQAEQRGRLSRVRTAELRSELDRVAAADSSAAGDVGASSPAMLAELATLLLDEQCTSALRESFDDACSDAGAATRDELGAFLPAFVEDMGWEGVSLANIADLILHVFAVASTSGGRAISWDALVSALRDVAAPPPTRQPTRQALPGQHASRAAELHTTPARPPRPTAQASPSSPPTAPPKGAPSAGGLAMSPAGTEDDMNVELVLGTMRDVLRRRAEASDRPSVQSLSAQLARNFRICDRDHNGVLDVREFSRCVAICRLGIHEKTIRRLHAAFDSDGSGSM